MTPNPPLNDSMRAMLMDLQGRPLRLAQVPNPAPCEHEVLLRISACGVCRTDLHIIAQVERQQGKEVFAFTRQGDTRSQEFACSLGAVWAGDSNVAPPVPLDAAILFAPIGALVPQALAATRKGATVVCAGIHMSDIPGFPYSLLWGERMVRSVANLTRADGDAFFALAADMDIRTARRSCSDWTRRMKRWAFRWCGGPVARQVMSMRNSLHTMCKEQRAK